MWFLRAIAEANPQLGGCRYGLHGWVLQLGFPGKHVRCEKLEVQGNVIFFAIHLVNPRPRHQGK